MRVGITGLLKIELPSGTVALSDGGVTEYDGTTYTSEDATLGALASISTIAEGIGDEIPAIDFSFAPPTNVAVTSLSSGAIQQSNVTLYVAQFDVDTGLVVGTPEVRHIGTVDQPRTGFAFRQFNVDITSVPKLEKIFVSDAMSLGATQHKALYPGETGHDNASGLKVPVAWGVESPQRSGSSNGGGGSRGIPNTRGEVVF